MVTITWKARVVQQHECASRLPDLERLKEEEIALQCEQAATAAVNVEPREITTRPSVVTAVVVNGQANLQL